jgi:hypothetical protein
MSSQPAYIARLKHGTTEAQFESHIEFINKQCSDPKYRNDEQGNTYDGIQFRFERVFYGYTGHFHPALVEVIAKLPVSLSQDPNRKIDLQHRCTKYVVP